jgi:hypothetical protein
MKTTILIPCLAPFLSVLLVACGAPSGEADAQTSDELTTAPLRRHADAGARDAELEPDAPPHACLDRVMCLRGYRWSTAECRCVPLSPW